MRATTLTIRQKGDVAIVDVHEGLAPDDGRKVLSEVIGRLADSGSSRVLLNMADTSDIDDTRLRDLSACAGIVGVGKLGFLNVSRRVKARLKRAGLRAVFATREEGLWAMLGAASSPACGPRRAANISSVR